MTQRDERHSVIRKLPSGGTCLLSLIICLSGLPLCRAGSQPGARAPQAKTSGDKAPVDRAADARLEPGKVIGREIATKQNHNYRVSLSAGQFLRAEVNQKGADMVVRLFGPDGNRIVETDSPNGPHGPEPALVVAESDGDYRIEVHCLESDAPGGGYEIKIQEIRPATPKDRKAVAAWKALSEADAVGRQVTGESSRKVLPKYYEALSLMQESGEDRGRAYALYGLGHIYRGLDEYQKTLEHHSQALPIVQADGNRLGEASLLSSIGLAYASMGEYQKALDHHSRALSVFRAVGSVRGEATSLNNISLVYDSLGEHQKALDYQSRAIPLRRAVMDRVGEGFTLHNIGSAYRSLGEHRKALDYFNLALPIFKAEKVRHAEVITLTNIGFVHSLLGDERKALDYYNEALSIAQAAGNRRGKAVTLKNMGSSYASLGDGGKALECYNQSLQLSLGIKDRNLEAGTRYLIARLQHGRSNLAEARSNIEAALEIAESLRTKVRSAELRASYFASIQQYYDFYIGLLMDLDQIEPGRGYQEAALGASERARARSLLEMLAEGGADIRQGVEPSLLERERSLKQSLDAKTEKQSRLLSASGSPKEIELVEKEVGRLLAEYQDVKAQIREKSPRYAALTQPSPLTLAEIQREVVDRDTLLLEYALGEERSFLWAVTPDSMTTFRLPKRSEVEKAAQRVYDLISEGGQAGRKQKRPARPSGYHDAASALSEMVLGPVAAHLRDKRLLIVSQGALSYIPFAALPVPEGKGAAHRPLIASHEIICLPSASVLAALRREAAGREPPSRAVAVLADPVFNKNDVRVREAIRGEAGPVDEKMEPEGEPGGRHDSLSQIALMRSVREVGLGDGKELPRLPFSRKEARAIFSLSWTAGAMSALDFEASRETATGAEMGEYRIVHFATHGILNNEHPELSGLVLSLVDREGKPRNGFLRLYNIYNLDLKADLVVLSACQTALGKQIKGEGLMGVTRGFMYAGAARVVASLWKVDDEATADLMERFYTEMMRQGQRPAAALRAAQLWMQKHERWQSPYYWAGFILQGEWR